MSVMWMDVDAALAEVPVNLLALTDDTDFKSRETGIVYNQAGMDLVWNFTTTAGATTQTAVTPTTAGGYDWAHQGDGMYTIEIPASGGASINNDAEGFGYFTGICTGVLHWRGPTIGFRDAALNNLMVDDAFSATRGLAGTALPAAAADAAGGLAISDAGGLDMDSIKTDTGTTIPAILGTPVDTDMSTDGANRQSDLDDIQTRLPAALVSGRIDANVGAISDDATAADNLESQYDTTGLTGDTFPATQAAVGSLAVGSAAISVQAESYVLTTGTQSSGTVSDTETLNSVYHEHTDTAGVLELYYQFDVTGAGVGTEVTVVGRMNDANDNLDGIYAYDWVGTAWDRIGDYEGQGSTTDRTPTFSLLTRHTGTGANLGKVRVRFYAASGITSGTLHIDQIFSSYSVVSQTVGYANGAVWLDTVNGIAGTESYVNGVADNPTDLFASAVTIAGNLALGIIDARAGSSITLAATLNNYQIKGHGATIALGGQDVNLSHFFDLQVSGIGTAAGEMEFHSCEFGVASLQKAHLYDCGFGDTITMTLAGDYNYINCTSLVAGASAPTFIKTAGQTITAQWRHWAGGLTLSGIEATDTFTIGGTLGTVTLNGVDGVVEIRGTYKAIVDNRTGSPTLNMDGAIKGVDVESILANQGTPVVTISDDIANQNDVSPAEVNAEMVDVMEVDTITLPGQVALPVTPTRTFALAYLYKFFRNRLTQNATENKLYADDETTVDQKAAVSDDTVTIDRGEMGSGP